MRAGSGADPRYSVAELARLCGVKARQVRAWAAQGLLPHEAAGDGYGFRELARARAMARLLGAGWSAARLGRAVRRALPLAGDLDAALAGLVPRAGKGALTLRLPDGRLCEPGGQGVFDFERAGSALPPAVRGLLAASDWFQRGVEAEAAGRFDEAAAAYERAVPEGGAEAWFNLGNCRYQLGEVAGARAAFEQAVAAAPDYAEAWNNLGSACRALQQIEPAIAAFRRALLLVPHYADAHYNLADALASAGDVDAARAHWRAYLTYDPNSRWAERVRRRLQAADGGAS